MEHPAVDGTSEGPAARHWREALAEWALPDEIRNAAPTEPYRLDPALFRAAPVVDTGAAPLIATRRAIEALPDGGTILDVGCGGGAATFDVTDRIAAPPSLVIGVDESAAMTELFASEADRRNLDHRTVVGRWPDVTAGGSGSGDRGDELAADVVLCHHVAFNVPDLGAFALALSAAARRRVVMELPPAHPQVPNNPLWEQFWDLERPEGPTAEDAAAVLREVGIDVRMERGDTGTRRHAAPWEARVAQAARMLCLGEDRIADVDAALRELPERPRDRVVLWWETAAT